MSVDRSYFSVGQIEAEKLTNVTICTVIRISEIRGSDIRVSVGPSIVVGKFSFFREEFQNNWRHFCVKAA